MTEKEKIKIWQITATRLRELMELKNAKQVDLIEYVNNKTGVDSLKPSTMSHYVNVKGVRSLSYEHAMLFSEYLGVMPGYLLGDDHFSCRNYAEYEQAKAILQRGDDTFFDLFNMFGYSLAFDDGMTAKDGKQQQVYSPLYTVSNGAAGTNNPDQWILSSEAMQELFTEVGSFLRNYLDTKIPKRDKDRIDIPGLVKDLPETFTKEAVEEIVEKASKAAKKPKKKGGDTLD